MAEREELDVVVNLVDNASPDLVRLRERERVERVREDRNTEDSLRRRLRLTQEVAAEEARIHQQRMDRTRAQQAQNEQLIRQQRQFATGAPSAAGYAGGGAPQYTQALGTAGFGGAAAANAATIAAAQRRHTEAIQQAAARSAETWRDQARAFTEAHGRRLQALDVADQARFNVARSALESEAKLSQLSLTNAQLAHQKLEQARAAGNQASIRHFENQIRRQQELGIADQAAFTQEMRQRAEQDAARRRRAAEAAFPIRQQPPPPPSGPSITTTPWVPHGHMSGGYGFGGGGSGFGDVGPSALDSAEEVQRRRHGAAWTPQVSAQWRAWMQSGGRLPRPAIMGPGSGINVRGALAPGGPQPPTPSVRGPGYTGEGAGYPPSDRIGIRMGAGGFGGPLQFPGVGPGGGGGGGGPPRFGWTFGNNFVDRGPTAGGSGSVLPPPPVIPQPSMFAGALTTLQQLTRSYIQLRAFGVSPLGAGVASLTSGMEGLTKAAGPLGMAIGAVGVAAFAANRTVSQFAESMKGWSQLQKQTGFDIGFMRNVTDQFERQGFAAGRTQEALSAYADKYAAFQRDPTFKAGIIRQAGSHEQQDQMRAFLEPLLGLGSEEMLSKILKQAQEFRDNATKEFGGERGAAAEKKFLESFGLGALAGFRGELVATTKEQSELQKRLADEAARYNEAVAKASQNWTRIKESVGGLLSPGWTAFYEGLSSGLDTIANKFEYLFGLKRKAQAELDAEKRKLTETVDPNDKTRSALDVLLGTNMWGVPLNVDPASQRGARGAGSEAASRTAEEQTAAPPAPPPPASPEVLRNALGHALEGLRQGRGGATRLFSGGLPASATEDLAAAAGLGDIGGGGSPWDRLPQSQNIEDRRNDVVRLLTDATDKDVSATRELTDEIRKLNAFYALLQQTDDEGTGIRIGGGGRGRVGRGTYNPTTGRVEFPASTGATTAPQSGAGAAGGLGSMLGGLGTGGAGGLIGGLLGGGGGGGLGGMLGGLMGGGAGGGGLLGGFLTGGGARGGGAGSAPGTRPPGSGGAAPAASDLDAAAQAIRTIESGSAGGNYGALGPRTRSGDRAYGAYQVMGANVGNWTEKHYGKRLTPQEFLQNKEAQDAVFKGEFGGYMQRFGPEGAAQAWFGGPGSVGKTGRKDVLGTSVGGYGSKFGRLYSAAGGGALGAGDGQPQTPGSAQKGPQQSQGDGTPPAEIMAKAREVAQLGPQELSNFMARSGYPKHDQWCGDFAASVVKAAGGTPPKNWQMASNWRNVGPEVSWKDAQPGDIAVAKPGWAPHRGSGQTGDVGSHVTILSKKDMEGGTFGGLGGNQGTAAANTKDFSARRFQFYRPGGFEDRRARGQAIRVPPPTTGSEASTRMPSAADERAALDGAQMGAMSQTVKGEGYLKVDVNAPRGAKVDTGGSGLFAEVRTNRRFQMPTSDQSSEESYVG